ncbi:MAG TPA: hypothetical protein PKG52_07955 [bacterium]|nr:hypothetical protein [bacterium]HPS29965.1 hypothetical protein [bacterium]
MDRHLNSILKRTLLLTVLLTVLNVSSTIYCEENDLEVLASFLKGRKISVEILETKYSCMTLEKTLKKGLTNINDLEKAVVSSRKNTRVAGLLPEISFWGKYKSDEKLYLYQRNNVSVGKDYITVGPDENNTTYGDISSFEVGGRITFDLTKLLYNPDTIRFSEQEQKLYFLRIEIVDKLSYIFFFNSMLNAAVAMNVEMPEEKLLVFQLTAKKFNGWFKSIAGFDLNECGEKK